MQVHPRVGLEPRQHAGVFVGGVVIDDRVQCKVLRRLPGELLEEGEELIVTMLRQTLADHLAADDIEGSKERGRAVALVGVGLGLRPSALHRQARLSAVQGLDLALLIDTEDNRFLRRVQVEANDIGQLLEKTAGRWRP